MAAAQLDPELFLPEPEAGEVKYTIISVDDHVVEPPWLFERYLPDNLKDRGPKLIETPKGDDPAPTDRRNLGRLRSYARDRS